jgi:tRNA(Arg) A34 adenosine deaminase TadA
MLLKNKVLGMKRSFYIVLLIIFALLLILFLIRSEYYQVFSNTELVELSKRELRNTAIQAIGKGDDPVSAIVLYNYSLIGRGHNTLFADTNAAGHSVINALNDAIKSKGWEQFNSLDKNLIIVMSTTEPCQMCKAALLEYGIKRIEFMNKKSINYWFNSYIDNFILELKKRQLEPHNLQDSLLQIKETQQINYQP